MAIKKQNVYVNILWKDEKFKARVHEFMTGLVRRATDRTLDDAQVTTPVYTGRLRSTENKRFKSTKAQARGSVATGSQDGFFVEVGTEDTPEFRMLRDAHERAKGEMADTLRRGL